MAEAPIWQFKTDAYLGDTTHLTTIEHGAYLLLLITMFRNGGWLPNDPKMLARYARCTAGQWARLWPVLKPFFYVEDGNLKQAHLTDTLDAVRQKSKSAQHSARARWRKNKGNSDANASFPHSERNANQEPRTKKVKRETNVSPKKGTRLPTDWTPSKEFTDFAICAGWMEFAVKAEAEIFRDYWTAKPGAAGVKLDWLATWRNWIRRADPSKHSTKFHAINGGNNAKRDNHGELQRIISAAARGST